MSARDRNSRRSVRFALVARKSGRQVRVWSPAEGASVLASAMMVKLGARSLWRRGRAWTNLHRGEGRRTVSLVRYGIQYRELEGTQLDHLCRGPGMCAARADRPELGALLEHAHHIHLLERVPRKLNRQVLERPAEQVQHLDQAMKHGPFVLHIPEEVDVDLEVLDRLRGAPLPEDVVPGPVVLHDAQQAEERPARARLGRTGRDHARRARDEPAGRLALCNDGGPVPWLGGEGSGPSVPGWERSEDIACLSRTRVNEGRRKSDVMGCGVPGWGCVRGWESE